MEQRGSTLKWLLLGLALFLFIQVGWPKIFGSNADEKQPLSGLIDNLAPKERAPEETCVIEGARFSAELSTRGASLRHFKMSDHKYAAKSAGSSEPMDLVSTTREDRMPLRTDLRLLDGADQQVDYDDFDWVLSAKDGKSCTFTYKSDTTSLTKKISATGNAFELSVELSVQNLSSSVKKHRLAIEQTDWRTKKETEGQLGRMSEFLTETVNATDKKTERLLPDAFEPKDFKSEVFTPEKWLRTPGDARFVATSSSYFTKVVIPVEGPAKPFAESQIEEIWNDGPFKEKIKDPQYGHVYRSRLAYPVEELQPNASVTYKIASYIGPKEREPLAALGISDVINLGWFAIIAKLLVSYLYVLKRVVGNWGFSIVLLTLTVRIVLFPLSLSQIKNSAAMRRLKPEMDALNEKYKDDAAQRGLALQELWRKNGVANPVVGCLPLVLQMPVWFALYTALQTAVELYHTPFGPLIPDLSEPGKYYVIPLVLGASSIVQQKIMPPQGDPTQQKMMLYLMPIIFTVMMLFLPAGLGVYMLTNTWLSIGQQILVERYLQSKQKTAAAGAIEVREKASQSGDKETPALGKGKARARG